MHSCILLLYSILLASARVSYYCINDHKCVFTAWERTDGRELHSNFEAQAPHFHPTFGTAYMEAFDALLTMRVKSWTTSDIGGLNSGSCCTRSFKLVVCLSSRKGDDRSKISLFYLNAAANNVSKTRQCLFRTLSLNGRIYHLCYGINIIELRSGPSHQMLFSPWT